MSEQQHSRESVDWAHLESPEFRAAMRDSGVTFTEATERLRAAAQHFDLAEFEALLAAHRPDVLKRTGERPSRLTGILQRLSRWGRWAHERRRAP